ncbi:MAG TPA: peptidoglycan-associated lipoprotein Pal [Gemmatimonadales bacterium]|nr:peptidoglycan-associated lipoprotein Pal [Gemmatimonadales bacterium]
MKSRSLLVFALLAAAACGGKKPAETPAPAPAPAPIDSTAIKARMRQDSINAAEARARAAADAAARAAAQLQAQLSAEVSAMIHFDFDKADIKPEDQANLDRKAAILKANPGLSIQIAGNCDNRGSDEYNLALGNRRAAAAQRYLINQGVSASQITIVSYGEERPVNPGNDEAAWAENRNDQFTPTAGGNNLVAPK